MEKIKWLEQKRPKQCKKGNLAKNNCSITTKLCNVNDFFFLLNYVCKDIDKLMVGFMWDKFQDSRIIWRSWDRMSTLKSFGRLGFRSVHDLNLALSCKQG